MSDVAPQGANIQAGLLELFCDALDAAVIVTDKFDCLTFASKRLLKFFALPEERLRPGTRARDFFGSIYDSGLRFGFDPDLQLAGLSREEWIARRIAFNWRERYETQEQIGRERWIRIINRRLPSGVGLAAILDISDHKKREIAWKADSERIKLTEDILDELPLPVFVQDQNLNFAAVNKAFCTLQATTPDSLLGRSIWDIFAPDLASEHDEASRRQLATGGVRNALLPMRRPDGQEISMLASSRRIGHPGHFYLANVFSDITGYVGSETGRQDRPLTEGVGQPSDEVAAASGPEPAAGVGPPGETGRPGMPQDRIKRVVVMSHNSMAGEELVAAIKAMGHDSCAIRDREELRNFLVAARQAGLSVDSILVELPMEQSADIREIRELRALASIHGIPCHDVPPRENGTVAAGALADLFGLRRLAVIAPPLAPEPVSIPVGKPALTVMPPPSMMPEERGEGHLAGKIEVLVVEDNNINRFAFQQILESLGVCHRIVATAAEAVASYRTKKPSLMLIDLTLPDMDSCDLARFLREEENGPAVPLIGVMSHLGEDDRDRALAAGMDATLVKPLSPDAIDAILRRFVLGDNRDAQRAS